MDKKKTFEECLENLKYTRDFELYLDVMNELRDKYLIILCTKEASGPSISEAAMEKIHCLGFSDFPKDYHMMYAGAADRGNVICSKASAAAGEPVSFDETAAKAKLSVLSALDKAEITIDGKNWSLDERGLNFAVYDPERSEIVDVAFYDAFEEKPQFYHRNFFYGDEYIAEHIYMPEKYMDAVARPIKRSLFSNRSLGVREVENGIILPNKRGKGVTYGGVCDENFNFISGRQLFDPGLDYHDNKHHIADSYTVPSEEMDYLNETVVYGGTMTNHPGHLILESFADRTWWFLKNADSRLKIAVATISYEHFERLGYAYFIKQYFDAFGISEDRIIFVEKPTKFKKVIVPDQSEIAITAENPYEFTSEYSQVFQHIKQRVTPAAHKKIYLTKRQTVKGNIIGEDFFIDFFKKHGFDIIHPEEHSIKETAELMYGADEVVAVEGTNAFFAIFCRPTVKLTVLTRMFDSWDLARQIVHESVGIKDFFIVNASGNFIVNKNFNDGYISDPYSLWNFARAFSLMRVTNEFKKYVKFYFNEDLDITPEESLKSVLYEYLAFFPEHYSKHPTFYDTIKEFTMLDVLQNMSEVFHGKEFDTSKLNLDPAWPPHRTKDLLIRLKRENEANLEQIKALTDENKDLKLHIAQLEDRISRLCGDGSKQTGSNLQKNETEEKIPKNQHGTDELTKQLIQATEENT